jgi:SAM-dependent methyltransferase
VVAVDLDPWALELGRRTAFGAERIHWIEADLLDADWTEQLPVHAFDAVVATTALHWFNCDAVARIYGDVATQLVAGGVFLAGVLAPGGDAAIGELARQAQQRRQERAVAARDGEDWSTFWEAARDEPAFRELLDERARRLAWRHPQPVLTAQFHAHALAQAGFAAVGEVWREHQTTVIMALR